MSNILLFYQLLHLQDTVFANVPVSFWIYIHSVMDSGSLSL